MQRSVPNTIDEESLARRIESAVERTAQKSGIDPKSGSAELLAHDSPPATSSRTSDKAQDSANQWGGLPAPWEPMPAWISPPETQDTTTDTETSSMPAMPSEVISSSSSAAAPARADVARSLPDAEPPKENGHEEAEQNHKKVGPDLDALAKQVYAIMRQRLAADRRREFMY